MGIFRFASTYAWKSTLKKIKLFVWDLRNNLKNLFLFEASLIKICMIFLVDARVFRDFEESDINILYLDCVRRPIKCINGSDGQVQA
jgi:hypothetical protein